jgi:predicted nicotinamide N-methyase
MATKGLPLYGCGRTEGQFVFSLQAGLTVRITSEESPAEETDARSIRTLYFCTSTEETLDTAGRVWYAGLALSQYLVNNPEMVTRKRICELGAGTAIPGVVCGALGAEMIVLTDLEENVNKLEECITRNKAILDDCDCEAQTHRCAFGSSEDTDNCKKLCGGRFDVIIGADIGYDVELHPLITKTLDLLSSPSTQIVLCEEVRWSDIYSWYVEDLRELFIVDEIVAPRLDISNGAVKNIKILLLRKKT